MFRYISKAPVETISTLADDVASGNPKVIFKTCLLPL